MSKLFPEFSKYCHDNHYYRQYRQTNKAKFVEMFKEIIERDDLPIITRKSNGIWYYLGVKFK